MAKILKDDLVLQFLESKKATCLLPLIEMVGNLDELVAKGPEKFASEIPKTIDLYHKKLSDNDHIFEDIWETGTDEEIIKYGRERGRVRELRRIKKNEGAFLSRENVPALIDSLILLLSEARTHVTNSEEQVYLMKCREDSIPASANKIKLLIDNTKVENEVIPEPVEEEATEEVVDEVTATEPTVEPEVRIVDHTMINHSPKDSLIIREYIHTYTDIINADEQFKMDMLMNNWEEKFNSLDGNYKKDIIMKSYNQYYGDPKNPLEKVVADYAVWKHILPKHLLASNYFTK